jgi:hypothetical protein
MTEYQFFLIFAVAVAALFVLGLTVNIIQD